MVQENPVILIVGPTSVGKTSLSVKLAKALSTEIISSDSMQLYKTMDIGTAKITEKEMDGITHHLIDILNPEDSFSVSEYQQMVRKEIESLLGKKKTPILVGGSGLYLQAAVYDYTFRGKKRNDEALKQYESLSNEELLDLIQKENPTLAETLDVNHRRRLLRSLEIASDVTDSDYETGKNPYYKNLYVVGLTMDREHLYERINLRVDRMMDAGLVDEVKSLYDQNIEGQSVKAIGYKELYEYFDGSNTLEEATENIKLHSRRFAKRQYTWFRNKMDVHWYDVESLTQDEIISDILTNIKK